MGGWCARARENSSKSPTVGHKLAETVGVIVRVARGKTLVRHVEHREDPLFLADAREFGPLVWERVDAGRVVAARMGRSATKVGKVVAKNPHRTHNEPTVVAPVRIMISQC
jgi:hypothetical protein